MAVNLNLHVDPPSLRADQNGVIYVGPSRVPLDVVVEEYEQGMTPDQIVQEYDSLNLADVHAAIAYFLRHRKEVLDYLQQRQEEADSLRKQIQEQQGPFPTKTELIERQRHKHA